MTNVHISLLSGVGGPAVGTVEWRATKRVEMDKGILLPVSMSVSLYDGQAILDVPPTPEGPEPEWAWRVTEHIVGGGGITRLVVVPDSEEIQSYEDLVDLLPPEIVDSPGYVGGAWDHGQLSGLSGDDHPQYLTEARGDARYYTQSQVDDALANLDVEGVVKSVNGQLPDEEGNVEIDLGGGGGGGPIDADDITDATTVGKSLIRAADAGAARTAIGAGTSNLALGTTSSTAKAGDWKPAADDITDATTLGKSILKATTTSQARTALEIPPAVVIGTGPTDAAAGDHTHALDALPKSIPGVIIHNGASWPLRTSVTAQNDRPVLWIGPDDEEPGGMLAVDSWIPVGQVVQPVVANVAYVYRSGESFDGDWPDERPDVERVVAVGAAPPPSWMQSGDLMNIPVGT